MPNESSRQLAHPLHPGRRYHLFISYASVNRAIVEPFVRQLEADGFAVYFDQNDVVEFRPLPLQLADAMDASSHVLLCLTPAYLKGPWAAYEAQNSFAADPSGEGGRIVPVWLERAGAEIPSYLRHLPYYDLSEHDPYGARYKQLTAALGRALEQPHRTPEPEQVRDRWQQSFLQAEDPGLTLFLARRSAQELAALIYRRTIGEPAAGATLDVMSDALLLSGRLPGEASGPLGTLRALFGPDALREEASRTPEKRQEAAVTATRALEALGQWVFPEHSRRRRQAQMRHLLPEMPDGSRALPDTPYRLHGEPLWHSSTGPVYAGRDTRTAEEVMVVLSLASDEPASTDLERVRRLDALNVLAPYDTGTIRTGVDTAGSYLILVRVTGETAQSLVERIGPVSPRAAYEVGAAVAGALVGLHEESPPLVHGAVTPAEVLLGADGSVRLVTMRADSAGTTAADLTGLRATVAYLMTGSATTAPPHGEVLDRLATAERARDALRVLRDAIDATSGGGLRTAVRHTGLSATGPGDIVLADVTPIAARAAWPRDGNTIVLLPERTRRLRTMRGDDVLWEDDERSDPRRVETARDGRLALGGWDGSIRYFTTQPQPVAALRIDGTVGDLRCVTGALIAGTWKRTLSRIADDGERRDLLPVLGGVHRIAVTPRGDRFAVADLAGRIDFFSAGGARRGARRPGDGALADIAYAGARLVMVNGSEVAGLRVDGSRTDAVALPGAYALLARGEPGRCLLLVRPTANGAPPETSVLEVDEFDRHLPFVNLPAGDRLVSCDAAGRRMVTVRASGCAYWRDGTQVWFWPDAVAAAVSADGTRIAVCGPRRVELYEDRA